MPDVADLQTYKALVLMGLFVVLVLVAFGIGVKDFIHGLQERGPRERRTGKRASSGDHKAA